MKSKHAATTVSLCLGLLVGCSADPVDDAGSTEDHLDDGTQGESGTSPAATQKAVDDKCTVMYSQAAGSCNKSAGDDDAAFSACLKPAKADLVTCCKRGGSAACAADATGIGDAQVKVDDQCAVAYSQAAGSCNKSAGDDDAAFTACLKPVKAALVTCCKSGGSPACAADAK